MNTGSQLSAIRPDGHGNVTKTHIAWAAEDCLPDICSPVSDGSFLFLLETEGYLVSYDVQKGEMLWEKELDAMFMASPSMAGGLLYLVSEKGVGIIARPTREGFKELERNELGEKVDASPAFVGGRIYLRGKKHLFCIGARDAEGGKK